MPFSSLVGLDPALTVLRRALTGERLATGYLFVGPPHVGKTALALALAQEANCERLAPGGGAVSRALFSEPPPRQGEGAGGEESGACGTCPTCRRLAAGLHPDVRLVQPRLSVSAMTRVEGAGEEDREEAVTLAAEMEDARITVEEIRDLLASASLAAVEARRRVYIVCGAESMDPAVANRLLKTLEEPPPDTTFILTTSRPAQVLPTLISRCQQITLHPLPPEAMAAQLAAAYAQAPAAQRAVVAGLSAGAWGRAQRLMEEPAILAVRKEILEMAASLTRREPWESLRLAENLAAATERWWRAERAGDSGAGDTGERMLKAARDRVLRTQLRALLEVLESWFRDLLVAGSTGFPACAQQPRLINPDYREELLYSARRYPPPSALAACQILTDFRRDLSQNVNLRLGLEALWIRLIGLRAM
jgi:DNA polymerase-3 subunit delta'